LLRNCMSAIAIFSAVRNCMFTTFQRNVIPQQHLYINAIAIFFQQYATFSQNFAPQLNICTNATGCGSVH
jgi:hypothetical protein